MRNELDHQTAESLGLPVGFVMEPRIICCGCANEKNLHHFPHPILTKRAVEEKLKCCFCNEPLVIVPRPQTSKRKRK